MADLPRILAEPNLPFAELPRAQPDQIFQHLARVTAGLAGQFQQIEDASVEAESRRVIADTEAKINDAIKQGDAKEVDPDAFHTNTTQAVGGIYQQTLAGIKNERVKARFEDSLSPYLIKSQTNIDLGQQQKKLLKAQGEFVIFMNGAATRAGQSNDPLEIAKENANVDKTINAMIATRGIDAADGEKARIQYRNDVTKERVAWLTLKNPEQLLAEIKDPARFTELKGSERVALEQRALEAIRERRVADERAAQERIDKQYDTFFKASEAPNANLSVLREQVLADTSIDRKTRMAMVDRLNLSINAKGKGELDPFAHTDGNVYKSVLQGIYSDPGKWSNAKINEYVGVGLSIAHADQLRGELKAAQSGAGSTDIKKQILEQVDRYRHNQLFLPKDKRLGKNTTTEDILTNDRISQGILDQVWQRANNAQKPEDARAVLQELMTPYYEAQTKGFFDRLATFGTDIGVLPQSMRPNLADATAAEITTARKILTRNGVQPTPEAMQTVIERGRKQAAPVRATPAPTGGAAGGAKVGGMAGPADQIPYLSDVRTFFQQKFNRTLPISAEGQSATHDRMGYQHEQAFDVALSPQSHEGMALVEFLDSKRIPFIGFTAAVPGVATGPHIHVGKPSARMMPKPEY